MTGVDAVGVGALAKSLVKGGAKLVGRGVTEQAVKEGAEAAATSVAKGGSAALCRKGTEFLAKRVFVFRFMKGSPIHVFFRIGSKFYHFNGKYFFHFKFEELLGPRLVKYLRGAWWFRFPAFVLSPRNATGIPKGWTCVTGALNAFNAGNYYIPSWLIPHLINLFDLKDESEVGR
jgi:hypothetical protein